ncbi:Galectin-4-like [Aphelenchoides besseyi]|nr:Galectin-4-like [Aphelenchoides besseyi]
MFRRIFILLCLLCNSITVAAELRDVVSNNREIPEHRYLKTEVDDLLRNEPLTVQGYHLLKLKCVSTDSDEWVMAFAKEPIENNDLTNHTIPFYLAFMVAHMQVVYNSKHPGLWDEERHVAYESINFFHKNQELDIRLWFRDTYLILFIETQEVAVFYYRQPITNMKYLFHNNGFKLRSIEAVGKSITMPYEETIPFGGFRPGTKIMVTFYIEKHTDAGRNCAIHFLAKDDGPIPFELDFRTTTDNRVTRNSLVNGSWGGQVLRTGVSTMNDVLIECKKEHFEITVNGKFFCTYKHRFPPEQIVRIASKLGYLSGWADVQYFASIE